MAVMAERAAAVGWLRGRPVAAGVGPVVAAAMRMWRAMAAMGVLVVVALRGWPALMAPVRGCRAPPVPMAVPAVRAALAVWVVRWPVAAVTVAPVAPEVLVAVAGRGLMVATG